MCPVLNSPLASLPISFERMLNEFKGLFQKMPKGLSLLKGIEHQTNFVSRSSLPNHLAYRVYLKESKDIQKQVTELLDKGLVRENKSSCLVLVILVRKMDGSWLMCMDCHPINFIMIRYRHSIPCLDDLLDELHGVCVCFPKLIYEAFGLINAPSNFMRLINHVLRSLVGKCVVIYFDDILVYFGCMDDHVMHVKSVLLLLKQECLYVSLEKCMFYTLEVIFLGYIVSSKGIKVDPKKLKAIQSWPIPKTVGDVRSFHDLASFYRHFAKYFNTLIAPLNEKVSNEEDSKERAFQTIKEKMTNAHILVLPNFSKTFELECDTSNVGVGVVVLHESHHIAYFSEKFKNNQINFSTYVNNCILN
ncbi:Retrovirus-related Pol polyprotein from transposon 17.6, partial [Mucuna pruriens]